MKEVDIAIDATDVRRIKAGYYSQCCGNIRQFSWNGQICWKTESTSISQEEINNQNSHYLLKFTAKNPSHKEMLGPNGFTGEFYHIFKGRNDTDST